MRQGFKQAVPYVWCRMTWTDESGRLTLTVTLADAKSGSHAGRCDEDIAVLRRKPQVARQLARWKPDDVRRELREYGAWEAEELEDHETNLARMLWIACGSVADEADERARERARR